jgi:hypothetical protein
MRWGDAATISGVESGLYTAFNDCSPSKARGCRVEDRFAEDETTSMDAVHSPVARRPRVSCSPVSGTGGSRIR